MYAVKHEEAGNLVRVHYAKVAGGPSEGFQTYARGDVKIPAVGQQIKTNDDPKALPATTEGSDTSSGQGSIG